MVTNASVRFTFSTHELRLGQLKHLSIFNTRSPNLLLFYIFIRKGNMDHPFSDSCYLFSRRFSTSLSLPPTTFSGVPESEVLQIKNPSAFCLILPP